MSNAPATAPNSPAAATWPSTPTTGWSPTASKPTGTTRCAPCRPPRTTTNRPPPPPRRVHRRAQGPHPCASRRLPRPVVRPGHPPARTQTHGPPAHRRRHHAPRPTASTCTSASAADRPPASTVPIPPTSWQARQTPADTLAELDRLLDDHTDAKPPTHSTPPGTAPAKANRSPPGSCCTTPQAPPAQPRRPAPRPRPAHHPRTRRTPRRARHHHQGLAPSRAAHLPQGQRQEHPRSSTRPHPATPDWSNARAAATKRVHTAPSPGGAV